MNTGLILVTLTAFFACILLCYSVCVWCKVRRHFMPPLVYSAAIIFLKPRAIGTNSIYTYTYVR